MRKPLLVAIISGALLVGVVFGVAAQGGLTGYFAPFVVDIEQQVPVEVSVAVPMEGGDSITATVPMTVNVALRVSVEGPNVVWAEPIGETEPEVTISEGQPEGQLVDASGIPYQVESPSNMKVLQVGTTTTQWGDFVVMGEVENIGSDNIRYAEAVATIYDSKRQMIAVTSGYLDVTEIEPGNSSPFEVFFEEDISDMAGYTVRITSQFD